LTIKGDCGVEILEEIGREVDEISSSSSLDAF